MSCSCVNVDFGTYKNAITLIYPFPKRWWPIPEIKLVQIDQCIAQEVVELWAKGIETIESCCGHNKARSYIAVPVDFICRMKALGYENDPNMPHRKEIFITKSIQYDA